MAYIPESVIRIQFVLLFFLPLGVFAQSFELSGNVKNKEGEFVPFANVFLLNEQDSTLVKGTSANDEGRFFIYGIKPGIYYLKGTFFGDSSPLLPLDIQGDVKIGSLVLNGNSSSLEEVIVTGKQPTMERKADRLVFHVANSVVTQGNTWDLLRNTPGVINLRGSLQIRGQEATVYLNDRKVQLTASELQDLLEGLSGNNINSVEIIHNPPARYDSEGGPILNIVTSKSITPGYKGSLQGSYTQAILPKYQVGTSHYFKSEKLDVFANYSLTSRQEHDDLLSYINFINPSGDVFSRWDSDLDREDEKLTHNGSVIADYDIDEKNLLRFTSNISYTPFKLVRNRMQTTITDAQGQLDSTLLTNNRIDSDQLNLALDLSYEYRFDKEGRVLRLNSHFTRYTDNEAQAGRTEYFNKQDVFQRDFSFRTDAGQQISINTNQADYFDQLGSYSFETGFKYSRIDSESLIDYLVRSGQRAGFPNEVQDDYRYDETIYAGYVSLGRDWDSWALKTGLRAEQTRAEGNSITLSETLVQDYFELFPSLYLQHTPAEDHSLSLDYSRKLRRPNYRNLNPFRYYFNEFDYDTGNPRLRPSFSHNFNFNYGYKDTYFIDLYYRDNGKYIMQLSFQDNEEQVLRQELQNGLKSQSYGIDFTVSKALTSAWYFFAYGSLFVEENQFIGVESGNVPVTQKVEGFYGQMGNYWNLSADGTWTAEATMTYFTDFLHGSYVVGETAIFNIGLKKTFWNNRAVLSLAVEDLFDKANARNVTRYLNQDNAYLNDEETRLFRIGFTYKFGNFRLSDNQRSVSKKERERL